MKFFFLTTNRLWSGSEELWSRAALTLCSGHTISFSARFNHRMLDVLASKAKRVAYHGQSAGLLSRISSKLLSKHSAVSEIRKQLSALQPDVVVISQGNSVDGWETMKACREAGIAYVTISQLVASYHFLSIHERNVDDLRRGYLEAKRNFFVSQHNRLLNDRMLGLRLTNAEVVFNPCKVKGDAAINYPADRDRFSMAMVGRLECYHKGYDIMLEVLAMQKWRERPLQVNLYGNGPHEKLIREMISSAGIGNVAIHPHVQNVVDIWRDNQLLLMASRMEGMPLTLIEAMHCKRAAIVTDTGGSPELINEGKNGFIAEASAASLDAAMERAWAQRTRWREMGEAAGEAIDNKHPGDEVAFFADRLLKLFS